MSSFNKVILMGNVTRNPEMRFLPGNNTAIMRTGIAVNRKYKTGGEMREEVMFIDIVAFGRQAEVINEYVTKGSPILIDGRLNFRSWEQDGQKRSKHEVVIENFQLIGGRRDRAADMNDPADFGGGFSSADTIDEDDIPF